jgi:hypothetical protein
MRDSLSAPGQILGQALMAPQPSSSQMAYIESSSDRTRSQMQFRFYPYPHRHPQRRPKTQHRPWLHAPLHVSSSLQQPPFPFLCGTCAVCLERTEIAYGIRGAWAIQGWIVSRFGRLNGSIRRTGNEDSSSSLSKNAANRVLEAMGGRLFITVSHGIQSLPDVTYGN